ncbi:uncharacterized protein LOC143260968 [Megalopta genalis]|uniref:uncharacterized protein LOC143260968 n=1 Tax=Megalopta genalis TaxID=115081 RepID=UPI003FD3BA20
MANEQGKMEIAASEFRNAKLPNFWREEPKLWFAMLEREFAAYTVKADAVKCAAVIRHLDTASMKVVADVIAAPPSDDSYIQIKEALISRLAASEETQLRQLLSGIDLQNKRPSELLREMTLLAGKNVSDSVLCTLWLQRLPSRVQEVLSVVEGVSTEKLALLADKTIERSSQYELAAVAPHVKEEARPRDPGPSSEIAELTKRIAQLEALDGTNVQNRLIISDKQTGVRFLVDTGADVSVIPRSPHSKRRIDDDFKLYAANGTPINTYGEQLLFVNLGLRTQFSWRFIVADTSKAILGADFLGHYSLLVNIKNKRLIDSQTHLFSVGKVTNSTQPTVTTIGKTNSFSTLLKEFSSITRQNSKAYQKHGVQHHITTKGTPIAERARRLPPDRLKAAKAEFEDMMRHGICQPSSSQWASPLHMVRKKTGEWRPCGDYRRLNNMTQPDRYPLPHIHDIAHHLTNTKIYTTLDLARAYHQIQMTPEDRCKTAVITPFGLFEFTHQTHWKNTIDIYALYLNDYSNTD